VSASLDDSSASVALINGDILTVDGQRYGERCYSPPTILTCSDKMLLDANDMEYSLDGKTIFERFGSTSQINMRPAFRPQKFDIKIPNADPKSIFEESERGDNINEFTLASNGTFLNFKAEVEGGSEDNNCALRWWPLEKFYEIGEWGHGVFLTTSHYWATPAQEDSNLGQGANPQYYIAGLPEIHHEFGDFRVSAGMRVSSQDLIMKEFQVFFPKCLLGYNDEGACEGNELLYDYGHPINRFCSTPQQPQQGFWCESGTPNWYYYWSQYLTTYNFNLPSTFVYGGVHCQDSTTIGGYYDGYNYLPYETYFHVCPHAAINESALSCKGIDSFAMILLHENEHKIKWNAFWPDGRTAPINHVGWNKLEDEDDCDNDGVPNYVEKLWGGLIIHDDDSPRHCNPDAHPTVMVCECSYNGNCTEKMINGDLEYYSALAMLSWSPGAANYMDWANPGKQSSKRW
jgi:hypothetical protein